MDVYAGQQLWLNDKLAVVLAFSAFGDCEVVTLLWLGTGALPHANGQPRPGSWSKKVVTLLHYPDGAWMRDFDCPVRVRVNHDRTRQIDTGAWLEAFARTIRPAPVAY